jgi:hypothetical protein
MGSFEARCAICDELKMIREQCEECGQPICDECRDDHMIDDLCEECFEKT